MQRYRSEGFTLAGRAAVGPFEPQSAYIKRGARGKRRSSKAGTPVAGGSGGPAGAASSSRCVASKGGCSKGVCSCPFLAFQAQAPVNVHCTGQLHKHPTCSSLLCYLQSPREHHSHQHSDDLLTHPVASAASARDRHHRTVHLTKLCHSSQQVPTQQTPVCMLLWMQIRAPPTSGSSCHCSAAGWRRPCVFHEATQATSQYCKLHGSSRHYEAADTDIIHVRRNCTSRGVHPRVQPRSSSAAAAAGAASKAGGRPGSRRGVANQGIFRHVICSNRDSSNSRCWCS